MLHIGIIGTGGFSKMHAKILTEMEDVQIQAVCGTSKAKAEEFASGFSIPSSYESVSEMLDAEHLDAVYILVPPMSHGEFEMQLIERGIPFFVEKPLGVNTEQPYQILTELRKKPLITSVGYHFRYTDTVSKMKQLLGQQNVGMITGNWMGDMPQVAWWRDQERSGGQFIEQSTHLVDILRYCVGEIDEVYALYGNQVMHKQFDGVTAADVGTVTLKFSSGVIANISNTCVLPNGLGKVGITCYTQEGMLEWDTERLKLIEAHATSEIKRLVNPYLVENEAFIHALKTGDTGRILSDYEDAFKTQQVTVAALKSAKLGMPVQIG
ncbi:Gfo/Idh/MocA family oxidoreductase [Paenibacillus alginolyticus]|uniref:Gfo/Idh/MocA family protein n=1 Tax=Paenibacillus alginolyticus TaxID=59839 RepID=UPI00040BD306|nr:Gfo/Idh/MocA family oxidoreductase [Paenibacillus alginolyticus]MCY9668593.1 Gfo/Idh/MocA family oxidoreductase [Paenibacillus alginolyticus]